MKPTARTPLKAALAASLRFADRGGAVGTLVFYMRRGAPVRRQDPTASGTARRRARHGATHQYLYWTDIVAQRAEDDSTWGVCGSTGVGPIELQEESPGAIRGLGLPFWLAEGSAARRLQAALREAPRACSRTAFAYCEDRPSRRLQQAVLDWWRRQVAGGARPDRLRPDPFKSVELRAPLPTKRCTIAASVSTSGYLRRPPHARRAGSTSVPSEPAVGVRSKGGTEEDRRAGVHLQPLVARPARPRARQAFVEAGIIPATTGRIGRSCAGFVFATTPRRDTRPAG